MDPITIGTAAATLLPKVFGFLSGNKQKKEAEKLANSNVFTPYSTPNEILAATELAERNLTKGLPGYDKASDNIDRSSATAFSQAKEATSSSGDLLDSVNKIQYQETNARNTLDAQAASYAASAQDKYADDLQTQARYKDQEYKTNYLEPYIRKANLAAAMYGAGQTNIANSLDGLATLGLGFGNLLARQQNQPGTITGNTMAPIVNSNVNPTIDALIAQYKSGFI